MLYRFFLFLWRSDSTTTEKGDVSSCVHQSLGLSEGRREGGEGGGEGRGGEGEGRGGEGGEEGEGEGELRVLDFD